MTERPGQHLENAKFSTGLLDASAACHNAAKAL
jgi:hypothetical protein